MKLLYTTLLAAWCLAFGPAAAEGQQVAEINCAAFVETAVKPATTLEASGRLFPHIDALESATSFVHRQIQTFLQVIYRPLFDAYGKQAEGIKGGKGAAQPKGGAGQEVPGFSGAVSDLSEEAAFALFVKAQESRADFSCGHLPGKGTLQGWSGRAQEALQEVVAINASLNPAALQKETDKLTAVGAIDPELRKLNGWLSKEVALLPKKSIKLAEGFWHPMEDPAKAMALHRQFEAKRQQCFQQRFTQAYRLWNHYHALLLSAARRLDRIMEQTLFGNNLIGADRQLVPLLAGTQARILELQAQCQRVAQAIVMEALLAAYCQKETDTNIDAYARYARGAAADEVVTALEE